MVSQKLTDHKRSGKTHFSAHSEIRFDWLTSCSLKATACGVWYSFQSWLITITLTCAVFYRSRARVWDKKAAGGGGRAVVLVCVVFCSCGFRFVWFSVCVAFHLFAFPFLWHSAWHITLIKKFPRKLSLRALRGLPTDKRENFSLLKPFIWR